jgi:hypothetical protein
MRHSASTVDACVIVIASCLIAFSLIEVTIHVTRPIGLPCKQTSEACT